MFENIANIEADLLILCGGFYRISAIITKGYSGGL